MAILFINVLGCFIIGILTAWILLHIMHPHLVSFLVTGFCGGFTTFSSMVFYLVKPLSEGAYLTVLTYLCLNVVCGITAVYLGSMLLLHSREQYSKI